MIDALTEPLDFAFMQRAMIAAGFAAIVCAVVGTFVVLKGMAFMGDAVAHSSLAGMSVAYFFGASVFWGALAWVVPASLLITPDQPTDQPEPGCSHRHHFRRWVCSGHHPDEPSQ